MKSRCERTCMEWRTLSVANYVDIMDVLKKVDSTCWKPIDESSMQVKETQMFQIRNEFVVNWCLASAFLRQTQLKSIKTGSMRLRPHLFSPV